ncbi:MAG: hypothetical protein Q7R83_04210 [bacterium]|nr:hypothetical protein [bacterium]
MFGFGRKTTPAPAPTPAQPLTPDAATDVHPAQKQTPAGKSNVIPFPSASIPTHVVAEDAQKAYEEVAKEIGFWPAELVTTQLRAFFEREGIKIYDNDAVDAWLTKKREDAKAEPWFWRPLREKDVIEAYCWGGTDGDTWEDDHYSDTLWRCRPYDRLVPRHALEKVAKIIALFDDRVKFFVSHYDDPNADPFIMVMPAMADSGGYQSCFIFDYWDEPGFGV